MFKSCLGCVCIIWSFRYRICDNSVEKTTKTVFSSYAYKLNILSKKFKYTDIAHMLNIKSTKTNKKYVFTFDAV